MKPQVLAFYLPQFHPFPENDEWWGKGFTEWTNVGKAKPLFKGHYQPRVPADLGYYDLRLPLVREQQVELAKEAGVTAFCYWHYWFGNGKRLLADVFQEVLDSGSPDFPFCLAWANHTWRAVGCTAGNYDPRILVEQTYPGLEDAKMHFDFLVKVFRDERYLKIEGKPFLLIYDTNQIPELYIHNFRKWAKENGFPDLYLVGNLSSQNSKSEIINKGFDAVTYGRLGFKEKKSYLATYLLKVENRLKSYVKNMPPHVFDYKNVFHDFINKEIDSQIDVVPQIYPQWDHSPRTGPKGNIYINSTPELFKEHVKDALDAIKDKPEHLQILILKSWNEWAEGNYMEPDLKYGKGFIKALRSALEENK